MKLALDHWHIEVSSICTLKCPRCVRTEVPETLLNRSLNLQFFKEQIGEQWVKHIKKITFCGDDGDPIYAKQFLNIIAWLKKVNPDLNIVIITNGSYKPTTWWYSIAQVLNEHDELHWSLDGWNQESNSKYRVNCDWSSIVDGIKTFTKHNISTYTVIATIAFRFNENHLDNILQIAKDYNIDCWQLTKSTKFGSVYPHQYGNNDLLEPTNKSLIAQGHRFERDQTVLSDKVRPGEYLKQLFWKRANDIHTDKGFPALCKIGNKGVFLKATGEFYPCCWIANRYEHNMEFIKTAQKLFNLNLRTLDEILADSFWDTFNYQYKECSFKCTQSKLLDKDHVTQW